MGGGPDVSSVVAAIANGQTTSNAIRVGQMAAVALLMPAAFTGATVSFEGSIDDTNYFPVYSANVLYDETVVLSAAIVLTFPLALSGFTSIKIVSASAEGAARSVTVLLRRGE